MNPSRIKKDQDAVDNILGILETTFIDPLSPLPLMCILTGVVANEKVTKDMLLAETLGQAAMRKFLDIRLGEQRAVRFFDPIKKLKLATFSSMKKVKPCKVNSKIVPLQAIKDLFAKISLVAQIRYFDFRSIFKYPLGPLPWALAEPSGALKKTSKASLLHKTESNVQLLDSLHGEQVFIIDGMSYVQQSKVYNKTFGHFAMDLLSRILAAGKKASRIDVVFDVSRNVSIKNVERDRRSSGNQLLFKTIVSSDVIKQWPLFLSCNENKNALIAFVSEWKKEKYRSLIESKCVYVTNGENVFKINHDSVFLIENLKSNY